MKKIIRKSAGEQVVEAVRKTLSNSKRIKFYSMPVAGGWRMSTVIGNMVTDVLLTVEADNQYNIWYKLKGVTGTGIQTTSIITVVEEIVALIA